MTRLSEATRRDMLYRMQREHDSTVTNADIIQFIDLHMNELRDVGYPENNVYMRDLARLRSELGGGEQG